MNSTPHPLNIPSLNTSHTLNINDVLNGQENKSGKQTQKPKEPKSDKKSTPCKPYFVDTKEEYDIQAGIDEVARGTLFGRVYACACIFPKTCIEDLENYNATKKRAEKVYIRDSKTLSRLQRERAYEYIKTHALSYAVSWLDATTIDVLDIRQASMRAMNEAISELSIEPHLLLIDGDHFSAHFITFGQIIPHVCIPQGDNAYFSIACASIVAKVEHDKYIAEFIEQYPHLEVYDIQNNMGYGTKKHMDALKRFGGSPWHRWSYRPVANSSPNRLKPTEEDIAIWTEKINQEIHI